MPPPPNLPKQNLFFPIKLVNKSFDGEKNKKPNGNFFFSFFPLFRTLIEKKALEARQTGEKLPLDVTIKVILAEQLNKLQTEGKRKKKSFKFPFCHTASWKSR